MARRAKNVFVGETMICVMCGAQQQSDPGANTQWRAVELDGTRFYACPNEFPPDGSPSVKAFTEAYLRFVRRAAAIIRGAN
jgi:hypothetical protein